MLGNKNVHAYHVPSQKKHKRLSQRPQTLKNKSKFPTRIKTIPSRKFSRVTNAISEQKISHVRDGHVCSSLSLSNQVAG